MLLFEKSYNSIVSKYIVPLCDYGVSYKKIRPNALRTILTTKPRRITVVNSKDICFQFEKDVLLKALVNDIEQFYIRTLLQGAAIKKIYNDAKDPCTNWNIVTNYYYAYFLAGLFLRLCYRGTFYFDTKTQKELKRIITAFLPEEKAQNIAIGNNYFFQIALNEKDLEYTLTLHESSRMTHELVWDKIGELIEEIKANATKDSNEYTVLESISTVNHHKKAIYPSQLRNIVNYQPYYGISEIEKKYSAPSILDCEDNWLSSIMEFESDQSDDEQKQINLFTAYVRYLYTYTFNLINEYIDRRGRKSGILSAINKNREHKITAPCSVFNYN